MSESTSEANNGAKPITGIIELRYSDSGLLDDATRAQLRQHGHDVAQQILDRGALRISLRNGLMLYVPRAMKAQLISMMQEHGTVGLDGSTKNIWPDVPNVFGGKHFFCVGEIVDLNDMPPNAWYATEAFWAKLGGCDLDPDAGGEEKEPWQS